MDKIKEDSDIRLDDLQINNLFLFQEPGTFCFGVDAVLLADYVKVPENGRVLDMCSGNGIVPVLLSARTKAKEIKGIEIQKEQAELAKSSIEYNGLSGAVEVINADIRHMEGMFPLSYFDAISCNPPYMKVGEGLHNPDIKKAIARHEIECTIGDVVKAAAAYLKPGGSFFLVHRPYRLPEILEELAQYKLSPKRFRFVHSYKDKEASLVLIESVRGGKPYSIIEPPLIIYREKGVYSEEIDRIYGRQQII